MNPLDKLFADNKFRPRRYEVKAAAAADETEVFLYDAIGGFWGIDAGQFVKDLKAINSSTIHLRVNCPGGEVNAARAIATAIAQHPSKIIAHVDGVAASAASFLILAAKEIEATAGAFVMIHSPMMLTIGNAADHEEAIALLNKYGDQMVTDYMRRTGKDEATVRGWMEAETWFTAQEAMEVGLVDRIVETITPKNEWNLSAYKNAPAALCAVGPVGIAAAVQPPHDVQGSAPADNPKKEGSMLNSNPAETTGQNPTVNAEAIAAEAQKVERARVSEISRIGASASLPAATVQAAIANGQTVEAFKDVAIEAMFKKGTEVETRVGVPSAQITRDEVETRRQLMTGAILNRVDGNAYKVESANDFKHMSLPRMAEESLIRAGVSTRGKSPNEIAVMALHSTSDFPIILENSLRKVLLDAYGKAEPTYRKWAKKSQATDFKTMRRIRKGEMPVFLEVPEGGEITMGTMGEERESYAIATYGRGISFTRQMLINDDLGAFNDLAGAFGLQAARLENKTVYAILTANAAMADSVALFHADHGNSGTGAIGNTALDAMFVAMATQKGVDGVTVLNIVPKYLLVPPAKRMTAVTAMRETGPSVKIADQNWFAGMLEVVSDAELTDTAKWYGAADTGDVEYSHLAGAEGPQFIRQENNGGVLGVTMYAFLDFGAKAVGWKGLYYSTGS